MVIQCSYKHVMMILLHVWYHPEHFDSNIVNFGSIVLKLWLYNYVILSFSSMAAILMTSQNSDLHVQGVQKHRGPNSICNNFLILQHWIVHFSKCVHLWTIFNIYWFSTIYIIYTACDVIKSAWCRFPPIFIFWHSSVLKYCLDSIQFTISCLFCQISFWNLQAISA